MPRRPDTREASPRAHTPVEADTDARDVHPDAHERPGIALALLKDFYWIELGIRSYLQARGNPEFSRAEGLVIANISLGYTRPSDIARQLGVSRQAIHKTIRQMKQKGIVELVADAADGRIKQVVITDLARKMNSDGIVAMGILWKELENRLGKERITRAAKVLSADWGPPVIFGAAERE